MNLTLIATQKGKTTWFYVVDSETAKEKIMESPDEWEYMPVNDVAIVKTFVNLYADIVRANDAPGRTGEWFRMLAVEGEWYLAEIELSDNKKHYRL